MRYDKIISKPVVTEKSAILEASGKYVFNVLPNANKSEIKKAVEKVFSTKVSDVNILKTKSKSKRRKGKIGEVSGFKKAIVTLKKGQKIKIREEKKEEKKGGKGKEEAKKTDEKNKG